MGDLGSAFDLEAVMKAVQIKEGTTSSQIIPETHAAPNISLNKYDVLNEKDNLRKPAEYINQMDNAWCATLTSRTNPGMADKRCTRWSNLLMSPEDRARLRECETEE
jgi:hypothetical protein